MSYEDDQLEIRELRAENARLRVVIEKQDQAIRDMSVAIGNASEKARIISGITIHETNEALRCAQP